MSQSQTSNFLTAQGMRQTLLSSFWISVGAASFGIHSGRLDVVAAGISEVRTRRAASAMCQSEGSATYQFGLRKLESHTLHTKTYSKLNQNAFHLQLALHISNTVLDMDMDWILIRIRIGVKYIACHRLKGIYSAMDNCYDQAQQRNPQSFRTQEWH